MTVFIAPIKLWACGFTPEQYALDFVREELAGRRSQSSNSCLVESNFSYIKPVHDPVGERSTITPKLVRASSEKVIQVTLISREMNHYRADFEVQVREGRSRQWQVHKDSLEFILTRDEARGCALLLRSPYHHLRSQACTE